MHTDNGPTVPVSVPSPKRSRLDDSPGETLAKAIQTAFFNASGEQPIGAPVPVLTARVDAHSVTLTVKLSR